MDYHYSCRYLQLRNDNPHFEVRNKGGAEWESASHKFGPFDSLGTKRTINLMISSSSPTTLCPGKKKVSSRYCSLGMGGGVARNSFKGPGLWEELPICLVNVI